jgi:hypothetical protein
MNRMTRRHHRAGGCRLPLTALLLLRAGALLWAAAHAHAHAALLRGAATAASPEAFPTASELRPVLPAAAPPLSTAPTADPAPKQFLVTRPPLKLVDAVFHVKGKPGDRRWSDPRRGMADTEQEVGFGDEASAKDRKEQRRLRLLERATMHTKTRVEREAAARKSRVHKDKSQMRGRVSAWEKRHHPDGAGGTNRLQMRLARFARHFGQAQARQCRPATSPGPKRARCRLRVERCVCVVLCYFECAACFRLGLRCPVSAWHLW